MACRALLCTLVLISLAVASVLTWRFGPWYETGKQNSESIDLTAATACEGCCNGLTSNCELTVNEVLFPMVHNAMSSYEDYFVAANNNESLEKALVAGFRGLMIDSCLCDGGLKQYMVDGAKDLLGEIGVAGGSDGSESDGSQVKTLGFCHTYCDAGVRDPNRVLRNIKKFLDVNRNEVVILEFQINDNSLTDLYEAIDQSGLPKYVWRPTVNNSTALYDMDWPTMQSLIDDNSRLLIFAHGDGMQSCTTMSCPEGIMYTYDHFAQTDDKSSSGCDATVSGDVDAYAYFLMNHWKNDDYDLPSATNAQSMNKYDELQNRFDTCDVRVPNVVAVDFWDLGELLTFAKDNNMVRAKKRTSMRQ